VSSETARGEKRGASGISSLKIVFDFWRERPWWAVGLVLAMLAATGLTLAFPHLLRLIIDGIKRGISRPELVRYVVALVGLGLLRVVGEVMLPFTRGRINELYQWRVRSGVFRRVLDMGHSFTNKYPTGDVMERLDHDMNELSFFACSVIFRFVGAVLMVIFTLAVMLRMNWFLTLVAVLPAGIAVFSWLKLGPKMFALFMKWREKISEVNNQLQSAFSGIRLVKSYVMEEKLGNRFRATLDERVSVAVSEARMEARIEVFYTAIAEFATLLVLWLGGVLVVRRTLTLGEFVAFSAYVLMLLGPMFDIGRLVISGRRAQGTAERIQALKSHPTEVKEPAAPQTPAPAELRFEDVTFAFTDRPVLKGINLVFAPGQRVGIAGTVGSGKSALFRLMFRMADPQQGRLTLGGTDVREFGLDSYRRLFGYAPQEPMLFSDTVRNNVAFGRTVADTGLAAAIEAARFSEDLAALPKGLDEMLGERGTRLSGGQKERVAIARALVNRPAVVVFDDATSALDADTEKQLVEGLVSGLEDRTVIIVSHRLSVLATCDHVYVLDSGEVKEQGRHDDLLERRGLYWKLYQRQLIGEELERL